MLAASFEISVDSYAANNNHDKYCLNLNPWESRQQQSSSAQRIARFFRLNLIHSMRSIHISIPKVFHPHLKPYSSAVEFEIILQVI